MAVSAAASQQLSHTLSMFVWVSTGASGFLPRSKSVQAWQIGESKVCMLMTAQSQFPPVPLVPKIGSGPPHNPSGDEMVIGMYG